jgi:hypothetical protein
LVATVSAAANPPVATAAPVVATVLLVSATVCATVQLFDKAKEFFAVCRSFDDPNYPDGKLLGFCWFDRGGYTTYSTEEISNSKFHFVDLTLSPRLRIRLINEMIDQHILWAGGCGIPVVCSTSIRGDHKAFVKIHEKRGFTVNGSYAWMRTEKGIEWLRSQNSNAPQADPQS